MPRTFPKIAKMVRTNRVLNSLSQADLSKLVGYKNGQFISNVERSLCSVPAKAIPRVAHHVNAPIEPMIEAMVADYKANITREIYLATVALSEELAEAKKS